MEKKIAIVTGATGGIGKEFTRLMLNEDLDEIWAIARNRGKLDALRVEFGEKVIPIAKDLSQTSELLDIQNMLSEERPNVMYLINNAGIAKMASCRDFTAEEIDNTVNLNCKTPAVLCNMCIPYMQKGGRILNISSASSFQPLPYLNLYSSSKVFLRYYSRALNVELKSKGITATAVCPGWVDTDLLTSVINGKPVKFDGIVSPQKVCKKALKDAKRGKDMSVCTMYFKAEHVLAKIFPQKTDMKVWMGKIKKYL